MSDLVKPEIDSQFVLVLLGSLAVIVFFFYATSSVGQGHKPRQEDRSNENFLVPRKGGALQLMAKDEDDNIKVKLVKKMKVSGDTFIFRFGFDDEIMTLGLPIGKHVVFTADIKTPQKPEGELVARKYTPISEVTQRGYVDFLIKVYRANVHPKFPEGGKMSQHVEKLQLGDTLLLEGPSGKLQYEGFGKFNIKKRGELKKMKIGCISGGTGITPCYQVIQAALKNDDGTQLSLVFGNRTTDDILLKDELLQFSENYKERFKLFLTVDIQPDAKENWKQGVGFITKEMLAENLPAPGPDTLILFCGPPPFEMMMKQHLEQLGYDEAMLFKF